MIKANELRIGNLVSFNDNICMVTTILPFYEGNDVVFGGVLTNDEINFFERIILNQEHDKLSFIPITEDWMVKFGFEKAYTTGNFIISINGFSFGLDINTGYIDINYKEFEKFCNIKYVHQLQNLYFALTSEELTINHY